MTRLAIFLIWLLHWLPLSLLALVGRGFGLLLYALMKRRRHIVLTNLRLCFPKLDERERTALAREHMALLGRSILERGLAWWASERRLRRLVRIEGLDNLVAHGKRTPNHPTILLVPHFLGLDLVGTALAQHIDVVSVYARQKNAAFDRLLKHGRQRFGDQQLLSRQDGMRTIVKAMRENRPFFYLPDMDYGSRDAIFVPFFGTKAATITGMARLAKLTGARVHACIAEMLPGGQGYVVCIGPAWSDYPTDDVEADTRRMNTFIEAEVDRIPAQYYWVHKRFKTRPPGEKGLY